MTIGGVDIQFVAPTPDVAFEGIVAVCRRRWPHGVFLDAEETETVSLASPAMAWRAPSQEFFVFSDEETAEEWEELGPCPENWNRMLHFICDPPGSDAGREGGVTLVIDEVTADMRPFLDDLQATFRDSLSFGQPLAEAV